MILLDGKTARAHYSSLLEKRIKELSFVPCLVILQVGNRTDSDSYIKAKKLFAQKIGVKEIHVNFDEKIGQEELIEVIKKYNEDKSVHGIIVQLPLPPQINSETVLNLIDPKKDIDGLNCDTKFLPATARGIKELIEFYKISLTGKKVTVLGRSKLVGEPVAKMCQEEGAIVTVCHSKTENIPEKCRNADVLIVAIGEPNFIGKECIKVGQVVIDVGITRHSDGKLVGDVDFNEVKDTVQMITPVPGGVGQMTVLALFENLIDACYSNKND
ncbi:MAG: bifunctional 5,10-methylenetetrahydrofolate dehydrogenase/5,10-methenyltetrahydrofolate cyclohydrolase [Patescibacteria group bacterium]